MHIARDWRKDTNDDEIRDVNSVAKPVFIFRVARVGQEKSFEILTSKI